MKIIPFDSYLACVFQPSRNKNIYTVSEAVGIGIVYVLSIKTCVCWALKLAVCPKS